MHAKQRYSEIFQNILGGSFQALNLPICGLSAVTNIRDSLISLLILSVLAWIPTTQLSVKDTQTSPRSLAEFKTFLI